MNWILKKLKGWKTLIVNILLAVLPVLELTQWHDVLPVGFLPWYALAVALLNMGLRFATNSPVGRNR